MRKMVGHVFLVGNVSSFHFGEVGEGGGEEGGGEEGGEGGGGEVSYVVIASEINVLKMVFIGFQTILFFV